MGAKKARGKAVLGDILNAGTAGVRSMSLIEAARSLEARKLRLPRQVQAVDLPMVTLGTVATRGLVDRDINGGPTDAAKTGPPQGPFKKRPIRSGEVPTYPMLWAHSADRERKFVVLPDSCGDPRLDDEARAVQRWNSAASRLHANRDFQLNSQSLSMCVTPGQVPRRNRMAEYSSRQRASRDSATAMVQFHVGPADVLVEGHAPAVGRARITITAIPDLPVLDPRTLTNNQVDQCHAVFEDFADKSLLPANEAYRDGTRKALDRALLFGITSVLQLDPGLEEGLDLLRKQWCAEPSVHGGKGTRIDP